MSLPPGPVRALDPSLMRRVTSTYRCRSHANAAGYMAGVATRADEATLSLVLLLGGYAGTRTLAIWVDRVIRQKDPA